MEDQQGSENTVNKEKNQKMQWAEMEDEDETEVVQHEAPQVIIERKRAGQEETKPKVQKVEKRKFEGKKPQQQQRGKYPKKSDKKELSAIEQLLGKKFDEAQKKEEANKKQIKPVILAGKNIYEIEDQEEEENVEEVKIEKEQKKETVNQLQELLFKSAGNQPKEQSKSQQKQLSKKEKKQLEEQEFEKMLAEMGFQQSEKKEEKKEEKVGETTEIKKEKTEEEKKEQPQEAAAEQKEAKKKKNKNKKKKQQEKQDEKEKEKENPTTQAEQPTELVNIEQVLLNKAKKKQVKKGINFEAAKAEIKERQEKTKKAQKFTKIDKDAMYF